MVAPPFHEWRLDKAGEVWLSFYRVAHGFLLRFPDLADFRIAPDGVFAICWPVPGTDEATLEHLFLNQVLPMMQSAAGQMVLHGGAVEILGGSGEGGRAVAFLGPSGRGKSTLTASFAQAGGRFLTDDMLVVEPGLDGFMALPSHPSIRMWCDSRDAVLGGAARVAPAVSYTEKDRLQATDSLPHCAEPLLLAAAIFLGAQEAEEAVLRPLSGVAALAAWMENVFLLDIENRARVLANLDAVTEIARAVPSFAMEYPRDYNALPAVRRAILSTIPNAGEMP